MKKAKWTAAQIDNLLKRADETTNRSLIFAQIAHETGRRPNSVRNFYYKTSASSKKTFNAFSGSEVDYLLRKVILGISRGQSVRHICLELGGGDRSKMLRLQNKYRALLLHNREIIENTVRTLETEGYFIKSPYSKELGQKLSAFPKNIIQMPAHSGSLSDSDINNLFMGFVRLVRKNNENQIERLKEQISRLKKQEEKTIN